MAKKKEPKLSEAELDRNIASRMLKMALNSPKAIEALDKIQGSPEEMQHLPIFLTQMITGAREKILASGMPLNDKIWAANDGVLNELLDDLGYEGEEKDQLIENTLDVMEQYDKAGTKKPPAGSAMSAAVQQPPQPQQGEMV